MYSEKNRRRFRNNVQVNQKSKCWVWVRALTKGYGRLYAGGQYVYAHRYLYEYINGPVPVALELHHICGNKSCVRPDHLVPVTHRGTVAKPHSI